MTEPLRLRYVNQIVGGFVLLLVLLMISFVLYLVRAKQLFVKSLPIEMIVAQKDLNGLRQGTEVVMLGNTAGHITHIDYIPRSNDLRVRFTIKEPLWDSLFVDSIVRVRRRFGVGEAFLEVLRGPRSDELLPKPGTDEPAHIPTFVPEEDRVDLLAEQLEKVRESIGKVEEAMIPALANVQRAAGSTANQVDNSVGPAATKMGNAAESVSKSVDSMQKDMATSLKHIDSSTEKFNGHLDEVGKTVKVIEGDTQLTTASVRKSADTFAKGSLQIRDSAVNAFDKLESASDSMLGVMEKAQGVVEKLDTEMNALSGTSAKLNQTSASAAQVTGALKQHWLLKRYLKSSPTTRQAPPSGVRGPSL